MNRKTRVGFISAASSYVIWGILPIYWKFLSAVPSLEILAWRVGGCSLLVWFIILIRRRLLPGSVYNLKVISLLFGASIFIALNWGLFIWAVTSEKILEAGLGYYINPLINVILGVLFFSEKLGRIRVVALFLASGGVTIMAVASGVFPWISIILAISFGFYGLMIKQLPDEFDNIEILVWVLVLLGPVAGIFLGMKGFSGELHFIGYGISTSILLIFAGFVTFIPLWLFGVGARRLPLGVIGFLQYVAPTMMLLIGTLIYGEPFSLLKGIAFALVAVASGLYSSTLRRT